MNNLISDTYLMHYGVKGMKWGVRHDPELVGRRRGRYQPYSQSVRGRSQGTTNRSYGHSSISNRKIKNAKKLAIGAGIVAGGLLAAYGGFKVGKILSTQKGREAVKKGMSSFLKKADDVAFKSKNAINLGKTVATTPFRMVGKTPVGRAVKMATRPIRVVKNLNPIPKSFRGTMAGKTAMTAWTAAAMASDINTVKQWSEGVKKRGKITKKDVVEITKDIVNPIPDNIPGISKKKKY